LGLEVGRWKWEASLNRGAPALDGSFPLPTSHFPFPTSHFSKQHANMKKILFTLLLLPLTILLYGQGEVKFFAESDARQVLIGNYFEVSFILMNAEGKNFTAPSFRNFDILSGPSQSISSSSINGRWTRELRLSYTLQPKNVGTYKIGQASIEVNGKELFSKPISVQVLKGKSGATSQADVQQKLEEQVFIKAVPSSEMAYVGQQVVLDYKLYTTRNIDVQSIGRVRVPRILCARCTKSQMGNRARSDRREAVQYQNSQTCRPLPTARRLNDH